jgi:hypothetical protein
VRVILCLLQNSQFYVSRCNSLTLCWSKNTINLLLDLKLLQNEEESQASLIYLIRGIFKLYPYWPDECLRIGLNRSCQKLCAVNVLSKKRAKTLTRNGTEGIVCLDIVSIVHL